ncbi:MAG: F0F1 ATP synthase subunit epsilon [Alphaproteobacteria bacterium]|nr:F0F1 ATP synthase subunit epsilon [Pseudomonadota bacterium]TDI63491.1 MAG: F0F1 ATP synthase subunit epsilon [Alphaproteobacteria bacterium]
MADQVEFELVSPAKLLVSEAVEMVVVPGVEGDFGVLPGHAPVISQVRPGVIDIHGDGKVIRRIFVAGGFAEVTTERCTVLAEEARPVEDIDAAQAEQRLVAARTAVEHPTDDADPGEARARARELRVAEAQVMAAQQG